MQYLNDISIVIPEKDEDHTLLRDLKYKLEQFGLEVIIVDDGSICQPSFAVKHLKNLGYGQAIMTGIDNSTRPIICTMDGDGQHTPEEVLKLCVAYKMIDCDMLIGARRLDYESAVRMIGRKCLNISASFFAWKWLSDLNSGLRIFKRNDVIGYYPILCKQFSFTTSLTMSMLCDNHRVEWFPTKVCNRKLGKSHVNVIKDGLVTLYYIIRIGFALRTRKPRKLWRKIKEFCSR